jgi:wyosine [tRNA(Phe)-imidazoG37] synthetase (radical SAM superfamily)
MMHPRIPLSLRSIPSIFREHDSEWSKFLYAYPVISRRARGVSIGINLNPDKICNFNCVYCQINRQKASRIKKVNLSVLDCEVRRLIETWKSGRLFSKEPFVSAPSALRSLKDIAFSGDGEPTIYLRLKEVNTLICLYTFFKE